MTTPASLPQIPIPTDVHDPWALAAFVIAILVAWATYRQNRVDRRIGNVEGQVVNCHNDDPEAPTMRDDIDRANSRLDALVGLEEKVQHLTVMVERLAHLPAMVEGLVSDMRQVRRDQTADREDVREQIHLLRKPRSNGK